MNLEDLPMTSPMLYLSGKGVLLSALDLICLVIVATVGTFFGGVSVEYSGFAGKRYFKKILWLSKKVEYFNSEN